MTDIECIMAREAPDISTGAHPASVHLAGVHTALERRRVAAAAADLDAVKSIELIEDAADVLETLLLMIRFCWDRVPAARLRQAHAELDQLFERLLAEHPYEPGPDESFRELTVLLETAWGAADDEAAADDDQLGEITAWLAAVTGAAACIACCVARSWPGDEIWPAAIATAEAHSHLAAPNHAGHTPA